VPCHAASARKRPCAARKRQTVSPFARMQKAHILYAVRAIEKAQWKAQMGRVGNRC